MSTIAASEHLQELRTLVKRLMEQHREYASDLNGLSSKVEADEAVEEL